MFKFALTNQILEGKLIYISDDFSFDTINRQISGVTSVIVNDIQIDISIDHLVIAVWGICPHTVWQPGHVPKPVSQIGRLWLEKDITPGVSIRVTKLSEYWPITFDQFSGWLRVGQDALKGDQSIEFIEGCVAILREGQIVGLCLHPN